MPSESAISVASAASFCATGAAAVTDARTASDAASSTGAVARRAASTAAFANSTARTRVAGLREESAVLEERGLLDRVAAGLRMRAERREALACVAEAPQRVLDVAGARRRVGDVSDDHRACERVALCGEHGERLFEPRARRREVSRLYQRLAEHIQRLPANHGDLVAVRKHAADELDGALRLTERLRDIREVELRACDERRLPERVELAHGLFARAHRALQVAELRARVHHGDEDARGLDGRAGPCEPPCLRGAADRLAHRADMRQRVHHRARDERKARGVVELAQPRKQRIALGKRARRV